ncbi:polysaccharide pyruvyl transferase family protein [Demequina salsinemoris]|uniref:polysaccharide pyruvyl transferase family protein n=1 Tax=Demequina salsinemoris TaxID=577470 RepID=UPI001364B0A7|nr:polysaccharide pyruvyl transferase family protein [Demequina salsinemoris]
MKNYGSVLQSYATQRLIEELGYECEFVDYWRPDLLDSVDDYFQKSRWSSYPLLRIPFRVVRARWVERNHAVFNGFVDDFLNVSPNSYYNAQELLDNPPIADMYCVGSDQIWNSEYNAGGTAPFFATFAPNGAKRLSFSSSFGKHDALPESRALAVAELPSFSAVSVREAAGVEVLKSLGVRATHTLDPTLVLEPDAWSQFCARAVSPRPSKPLVYQLNRGAEFDRVVKEVEHESRAVATRLDISSAFPVLRASVHQPTVPNWVALFRDASHVVTDSFHGVAFALIFNKPMTVVLPPTYGDRLLSILELAGLQDRVVPRGEAPNFRAIDWSEVNRRVDASRLDSREFLRRALAV